ncbi:MAG: hypothetical protein JW794_09380, partial [Candidatus Cloacimonetes bacterium]|nr:hypothetical protein [Candidatus Cloacimonadota bacterium]
ITFVHRVLKKNDRFETSLIARKEEGYFLGNNKVSLEEKIADSDVLILHNPETFNFDTQSVVQSIETFVSRGGNILYLGKIDPSLSHILPIKESRYKQTVQTVIMPTAAMQNYQTFSMNRDVSPESFWNSLPPITTYFYESKPRTEVLARADIVSENPVIVFSSYLQGHVLYFSGYDFYRWKMWEDIKKPWFDQFFINIGQWLLNTDVSQKFMCSSEKLSYMEGETVEFSAHIFDEKMNLVKNQDIKISIYRDDSLVQEKFLIEKDNHYSIEFRDLASGKYTFFAEAILGRKIFKDTGSFLIEERTLEQSTQGIQTAYLQYIASKTKGKMIVENSDLTHLLEIVRKNMVIKTTRDIELWKKWYLAVIAIFLVATELFLRKKKGLL